MLKWLVAGLVLLAVIGVVSGGRASNDNVPGQSAGPDAIDTSNLPALRTRVRFTARHYPGRWPFTVPRGTVTCRHASGPGVGEVIFTAAGQDYAVNGTARQHITTNGLADVNDIWRKDPSVPGARIDLSPILNDGLSLCR